MIFTATAQELEERRMGEPSRPLTKYYTGAMACSFCRKRKIRCDGAKPTCQSCQEHRRECEYIAVSEKENAALRMAKRARRARLAAIEILSEPSLQVCISREQALVAMLSRSGQKLGEGGAAAAGARDRSPGDAGGSLPLPLAQLEEALAATGGGGLNAGVTDGESSTGLKQPSVLLPLGGTISSLALGTRNRNRSTSRAGSGMYSPGPPSSAASFRHSPMSETFEEWSPTHAFPPHQIPLLPPTTTSTSAMQQLAATTVHDMDESSTEVVPRSSTSSLAVRRGRSRGATMHHDVGGGQQQQQSFDPRAARRSPNLAINVGLSRQLQQQQQQAGPSSGTGSGPNSATFKPYDASARVRPRAWTINDRLCLTSPLTPGSHYHHAIMHAQPSAPVPLPHAYRHLIMPTSHLAGDVMHGATISGSLQEQFLPSAMAQRPAHHHAQDHFHPHHHRRPALAMDSGTNAVSASAMYHHSSSGLSLPPSQEDLHASSSASASASASEMHHGAFIPHVDDSTGNAMFDSVSGDTSLDLSMDGNAIGRAMAHAAANSIAMGSTPLGLRPSHAHGGFAGAGGGLLLDLLPYDAVSAGGGSNADMQSNEQSPSIGILSLSAMGGEGGNGERDSPVTTQPSTALPTPSSLSFSGLKTSDAGPTTTSTAQEFANQRHSMLQDRHARTRTQQISAMHMLRQHHEHQQQQHAYMQMAASQAPQHPAGNQAGPPPISPISPGSLTTHLPLQCMSLTEAEQHCSSPAIVQLHQEPFVHSLAMSRTPSAMAMEKFASVHVDAAATPGGVVANALPDLGLGNFDANLGLYFSSTDPGAVLQPVSRQQSDAPNGASAWGSPIHSVPTPTVKSPSSPEQAFSMKRRHALHMESPVQLTDIQVGASEMQHHASNGHTQTQAVRLDFLPLQ